MHPTEQGKRAYKCRDCGRVLFETDVPLGTEGTIWTRCKNRLCHKFNGVEVGQAPVVRPQVWTEWAERALRNGNGHVKAPVTNP